MTLIVGIRCSDGVILGSDSAVTFTDPSGSPTTRTLIEGKIKIVTPQLMMAGTGIVAMSQAVEHRVGELARGGRELRRSDARKFGNLLSQKVIDLFKGTGALEFNPSYGLLVAASCKDGPTLLSAVSNEAYQTTVVDDELPYSALGSGQPVAEALLGHWSSLMWPSGMPDLKMARLAMALTLKEGCRLSAYGVSEPIHIAELSSAEESSKSDISDWVAKRLTNEDMQEVLGEAESALEHFKSYFANPALTLQSPPKAN
jgi:hypothetical protein